MELDGRSQNTVPIASTQVAIKGVVQYSTRAESPSSVQAVEQSRASSRSLDADESTRSAQVE